ncbi:MAG: hypothetical protein NW223_17035 [Hyphomicrobiaceae bacterium]|nr:hypothetical protein [Hyphomicrobiaceae bacterium]
MTQVINAIVQLLQQAIAAIFYVLGVVWAWSFGQIVGVLSSNWQALPLWKQAVLALVVLAFVVIGYQVLRQLWDAGEKVLRALLALLGVLVGLLPYVVAAGVIAFAGGYVIRSVNF